MEVLVFSFEFVVLVVVQESSLEELDYVLNTRLHGVSKRYIRDLAK